ncbi:MAG: YdcF family protein [Clostridiaceae bacterium]|jgi:uncharacterized SAM-binding protein YcdF (DUF218 family)|nr:YdcF family protein [Clostridiaceae bacterium]
MYYILMLIGALGVLDTVLVSIYTGINVGTLAPGAAGVIIIVYVYIRLWVRKGRPVLQDPRARRLVCALAVTGILSFAFVQALIIYSGSSQEDEEVGYLIILGAGLHNNEVSLTLQERLLKGIEYLERHPDAKVIVSGGKGSGETVTEAEAMEEYLVSKDIAADRIVKEDKATSTMENFVFSREILERSEEENIARIVVITSDFHMYRAKLLARRAGFEPYGITCSTPISVRVNCHIREYFALIKSLLVDRVKTAG